MDPKELSTRICEAYRRDQDKTVLMSFKDLIRRSRKFGFPIVCTLADKSEPEQFHWAACLLLEVAGTWPVADVPAQLVLEPGSALYDDASELLACGFGALEQLRK